MATSTKDVLKLISTIKLFSVLAGPLLVLVELFFQVKHRFHKQSTKISITCILKAAFFFLFTARWYQTFFIEIEKSFHQLSPDGRKIKFSEKTTEKSWESFTFERLVSVRSYILKQTCSLSNRNGVFRKLYLRPSCFYIFMGEIANIFNMLVC